MTAGTLDVALDQRPRAERDVLLRQLRAERQRLQVRRDAENGSGWEGDLRDIRKGRQRDLSPEDVDRVLRGEPLEPVVPADDSPVRLAALSVAITSLAALAVQEDAARLQAKADQAAARLQQVVSAALRSHEKAQQQMELLRDALDDMADVRHDREALRDEDVADGTLPGLRHDVQLEDAAALLLRGLEYVTEAGKVARGKA
jgi:hypothetical protein